MTDSGAFLVALALVINELSVLYKANLLAEDFFPSNLVFLLSICLLLEKIRVVSLLHLYTPLGFLLEILLSTVLLECALVYIWRPLQFYLLLNADDILVQLYENETFNWLVCPLCCRSRNPSPDFVRLFSQFLWNFNLLVTLTQTVAGAAGVGLIARDYNFPRLRWRVVFSPQSYFTVIERGRMQRNRIERTASKRWRGSVRRIIASSVYNLSCFTHGCSIGWVSGVLGNEALTGGAWLAALPCLVALPAAPMFAVLADVKGRKAGAFCIGLSFIFSWSLAAWCGARGIWAARVAAGAGGAGALALAPLYCAEIAPRTRGLAAMPALASSCGILFAYSAGGILSAHALSLLMAIPSILLLISLLWLPETPSFLINTGKIQEAAKVMCWFDGSDFREDLTDVIEQQEVRIRTSDSYGRRDVVSYDSDTFQPMIKRSSGLESPTDKRRQKREKSACKELFLHRRARRALVSCFVVIGAAAGSGAGAVNSFAAAVLRHSAHQIPALNTTAYNLTIYNGTLPRNLFETSEAGSMLCGTALVLGAAVATFTVDKVGRKTLLLWSCSGIAFCLAILGIYCDPHLQVHSFYKHRFLSYKKFTKDRSIRDKIDLAENLTIYNDSFKSFNDTKPWYRVSSENFNTTDEEMLWTVKFEHNVDKEEFTIWLPVVLLSIVLFLYNIGLGSVPYVLISELFFVNVRSLASSFLITWMWLSNFFVLRYYGTIAFSIGLHATYYICSSITLLGAGYIYLTLPETKGKSQNQIDESLDGPWLLTFERKNGR